MTEKEKAELGMLYDASHDEELNNEYLDASLLLVDYNRSLPIEQGMRRGILKELLGKVGEGCEIRPPFYCDRGYNIEMGDYVFANYHFTVLDCAKVRIGNHVYIAPNVSIYTAGHPLDVVLFMNFGWIGKVFEGKNHFLQSCIPMVTLFFHIHINSAEVIRWKLGTAGEIFQNWK